MLRRVWIWIKRTACLAVMLMALVLGATLLFLYRVLAAMHPWLGHGFGAVMAGVILAGVCWYLATKLRHPTVLDAPPRATDGRSRVANRQYARYLARFMSRLRTHPRVPAEQREVVAAYLGTLRRAIAARRSVQVAETVAQCEEEAIDPVMASLDERAAALVDETVRDVMQGVTLSPWQALDMLAVMLRNLSMVGRIVALYDDRPLVREYLLIVRDVVSVVGSVNFLSFGNQLLRNLMSDVPAMGHFAEDVAQGTGAGLMTAVAGRAAMARCRAYCGWSCSEARMQVADTMPETLHGLTAVVEDVVMPQLRSPLESRLSDGTSTEIFERVTNGVVHALDSTCETVHLFVRSERDTSSADIDMSDDDGLAGEEPASQGYDA